jgi:Tfp pilus assembly protein PilV
MKDLRNNAMAREVSISRKNELGITIAETLVALSIFAITSVTFVAALGSNFKVLLMADQRTTAESLAKSQMEAINNAAYDSTAPYTYSTITGIPAGYSVNIVVALVNPETGSVSATDLGVQKVTVTVTCQQHSPPEVMVLESYKR